MPLDATSWRTCIDFGTAASKASACTPWDKTSNLYKHVRPLRLGAICNEPNPYVAESALLFDSERVFFGWHARRRASEGALETEVLHSFKTFLAAADLAQALNLRLRRSVDRSGFFRQRDALVLYVAYLLHLVEVAAAGDPALPSEARACPRRYAYPTWRTGPAANAMLADIFDHAAVIADDLGDDLLDPAGVATERLQALLRTTTGAAGRSRLEAGVYEAQAAAECHFAYTRGLPHHVIVFDMGAGTTDITSFEFNETGQGHFMKEIPNTRRTILLACDEVDKLLISHILDRARLSSSKQGDALWRSLALRRRSLKERLFADGAIEVEWNGKRYGVRMNDFLRDRDFQAFGRAVAQNFKYCLTQVELRAAAGGHAEVGVILAGGGASLPFIKKMAAEARPSVRGVKRLALQPVVPSWAQAPELGHLASIFPQVAISIGGAVARVHSGDVRF